MNLRQILKLYFLMAIDALFLLIPGFHVYLKKEGIQDFFSREVFEPNKLYILGGLFLVYAIKHLFVVRELRSNRIRVSNTKVVDNKLGFNDILPYVFCAFLVLVAFLVFSIGANLFLSVYFTIAGCCFLALFHLIFSFVFIARGREKKKQPYAEIEMQGLLLALINGMSFDKLKLIVLQKMKKSPNFSVKDMAKIRMMKEFKAKDIKPFFTNKQELEALIEEGTLEAIQRQGEDREKTLQQFREAGVKI